MRRVVADAGLVVAGQAARRTERQVHVYGQALTAAGLFFRRLCLRPFGPERLGEAVEMGCIDLEGGAGNDVSGFAATHRCGPGMIGVAHLIGAPVGFCSFFAGEI